MRTKENVKKKPNKWQDLNSTKKLNSTYRSANLKYHSAARSFQRTSSAGIFTLKIKNVGCIDG